MHSDAMNGLVRNSLQGICLIGILVLTSTTISHAQTEQLEAELRQFGDIELIAFEGRGDFLRKIDTALGPGNIKDPDQTFARLPRSPFTVTGRQNGQALTTCRIFVPAGLTPENNTEIFAELMRNWFGTNLNYASNRLIFHEARHCQPDHFGGDVLKDHRDEHEADLFAFNKLANTQNRDQLAIDITAFRMITSALIARPSHMTGLSLKRALEARTPLDASVEMAAFQTVRAMINRRAKSIATAINPTNRELIRAITELRKEAGQEPGRSSDPLTVEILIALDDAIAHLAPALHHSVANVSAN